MLKPRAFIVWFDYPGANAVQNIVWVSLHQDY